LTVLIAARDPAKTQAALAETNMGHLQVVAMPEAMDVADIVILAVPGGHTDQEIASIAQSLGNNMQGKIIIDATNPLSPYPDGLQVRWKQPDGTSGGEVLQQYLPDCKVYKAFNTIGVELMARPKSVGLDMLFCGPDDAIAPVVAAVGFTPRYMGPIRYARNLEAIAELWIHCGIPSFPGHYWGREWAFGLQGKF
jgi:8-hydroxy-5-deazaflavin:NADPH oxidoreductase